MRPLVPLAVLLLAASSVHASEWPQFHGDAQHTGSLASDFAPPQQLWWSQSTGGPIEGSPVVSDGRVFVGSTDGKLYAFDAISGSPLWTFDAQGPISGTPALSGGILYLVTNSGKLFALDTVTGKQRLSAGTGSPDPGPARTSPTIHQGRLYIGTEAGSLIAYSLEHLTKDWEFRFVEEQRVDTLTFNNQTNTWTGGCSATRYAPKPIRSSPAVFSDRVFFGSDVHALFAVDEFGLGGGDAGKTIGVWKHTPSTSNLSTLACPKSWPASTFQGATNFPAVGDVIRGAPAIYDALGPGSVDLVIVPAFDNTVRAYNVETGAEVWKKVLGSGSSDRSAATAAVYDNKVFLGLLNGQFLALNAATGADIWAHTAGDAIWSSAAVSNGHVVYGADDETIYVRNAASGAEEWRHRIGGDVRSSPALWTGSFQGTPLAGGVVYVGGSDGILYAFGGAKPPLPDLTIQDILYPQDPLPLDGSVDVEVVVVNAGNSSSPATEVKLFIDGALASTLPVKALGPGENATVVYQWKVPPNNHTLHASVDPAGLSREFDRSNNELRVHTPVARTPPPPPPPPEPPAQEQQQAPPPKKKSPGFEVLGLAAASAAVALLGTRRRAGK